MLLFSSNPERLNEHPRDFALTIYVPHPLFTGRSGSCSEVLEY